MVGEIDQEPSGLDDFKVNSGSISFGRFEGESLCWERRSSFSHNRYLEEVEKYSKPGSVTEKKAYFEAHFKKKGILSLLSPAIHQSQTYGENEEDGRVIEDEERSPSTDESWTDEKFKNSSEAEEVFEPMIQLSCNDSNGSDRLLQGSEINENSDRGTCNVGCKLPELNESNDERRISSDCPEDPQEKPFKEKVSLGDESLRKSMSRVRFDPLKGGRNVSSVEVSKSSGKKLSRTVNDVRLKKTSAVADTVKDRTVSAKVHAIKRAENEQRNRAVKPQSSEQRVSSGKVHQSQKRVVPISNLSRPRQENPPSRKISESAEVRIKKEKAEAELKQTRKGLEFKARPLPSFYRRASHNSDTSKDESSGNSKMQIRRCNDKKSSSDGIRASVTSSVKSQARKSAKPSRTDHKRGDEKSLSEEHRL